MKNNAFESKYEKRIDALIKNFESSYLNTAGEIDWGNRLNSAK